MGFLLFIIATLLWLPLTIINIALVIINSVKKHGFFRVINGYFKQTAIDIDRFGNHNFRTLLNRCLRKNESPYKHGDIRETISSVLGKNKKFGYLTRLGKIICIILDALDKNHCEKSIRWYND